MLTATQKILSHNPPPHSFDQTLIYSILDNNSSTPTTLTLEATPPTISIRAQIDGGSNRSITRNKDILHLYKHVTPFYIGSINEGGTVTCTGVGIYCLHTTTDSILIKMIYSESALETIISPTDIVASDQQLNLEEWIQILNVKLGTGKLIIKSANTTSSCEISLTMTNNIW